MKLYEGDLGNKYIILDLFTGIRSTAPAGKTAQKTHTRRNSRRAHVASDPVIHHAEPHTCSTP